MNNIKSRIIIAFLIFSFSLSVCSGSDAIVSFDDSIRENFRYKNREQRDQAASLSNLTVSLTMAAPFLYRANWDSSKNYIYSYLGNGLITEIGKFSAKRVRPYEQACEAGDGGYDKNCYSNDSNKSFFSGHTSFAFTGASLVCLAQEQQAQSDSEFSKGPCYSSLVLAGLTGYLRIAADQHYFSDVMVGAMVGILSGYYLPKHFGSKADAKSVMAKMPGRGGLVLTPNFYDNNSWVLSFVKEI
jgi:hypothetical protein